MTRAIANRHWSGAFRDLVDGLGGEFRRIGTIDAFVSTLGLHFASGCLVLEEARPDDLQMAIDWVAESGVPFQVRVDTNVLPPLEPVIGANRLERDPLDMPAMVLTPLPPTPPPPPGVTVETVTAETYPEFLDNITASGIPVALGRRIFPAEVVDAAAQRYVMARLDGRSVGIAVAVHTGESGGIYSVATQESARRRGVGTAVTWAAVEVIRDWGCTSAVLQSSVIGYSMYEAMGFREVVRYARYTPDGQGST